MQTLEQHLSSFSEFTSFPNTFRLVVAALGRSEDLIGAKDLNSMILKALDLSPDLKYKDEISFRKESLATLYESKVATFLETLREKVEEKHSEESEELEVVHVFDHDGTLLNHHLNPWRYYPGVPEMLEKLREKKAKMAIASARQANSQYSESLLACLRHAKLERYFELVVIDAVPKTSHLQRIQAHIEAKYDKHRAKPLPRRFVLYDDTQKEVDHIQKAKIAHFEAIHIGGKGMTESQLVTSRSSDKQ